MLGSMRLSAALALAAVAAGSATAQIATNPSAVAAARGVGGFTGWVGMAGAGIGLGLPPVGIGMASPYALSTVAGNPYAAGSLGLSPYGVGGYGLSTAPGANPFPYQYNPPYYGYGGQRQDPYNGYLTGVASVTSATGQYWRDIQQARLTREEARRSSFETTRKQIELERWIESIKPKTQDLVDAAVKTDLERARRDAPMTEVVSGKTLNDLLNNVRKLGRLTRGPNISLEEDTLKRINLASPAVSGSVGLLRDGGKFAWPLGLQEKMFEEQKTRLARNIEQAVAAIKADKGEADPVLLKDINNDLRVLQDKVNNSQDDLPISQYLEARRFMGQVGAAVAALKDPQVKKMLGGNAGVGSQRTVAELADHMGKSGLSFGPAAPGDEAAYVALYYALREFESGLALAQK